MLDMALNAVRFFGNESCGKCVPCCVGSAKLTDLLGAWTRGEHGPRTNHRLDLTRAEAHVDLRPGPGGSVPIASVPRTSARKWMRT
jgi:NADH:ubiquinone oxidoreductase subunit F (NADH-binding)